MARCLWLGGFGWKQMGSPSTLLNGDHRQVDMADKRQLRLELLSKIQPRLCTEEILPEVQKSLRFGLEVQTLLHLEVFLDGMILGVNKQNEFDNQDTLGYKSRSGHVPQSY